MSLTSAFDRLLRHDAQRYIIRRGVTLIILLLNRLDTLRKNTLENAPLLLKELAQSIQDTIHGSELKEVIGLYKDKEKSPSNYTIDKYDYLFRCIHFELIRGLLSQIYMLDVCRTAQHVAINRSFCCCPEMTERWIYLLLALYTRSPKRDEVTTGRCQTAIYAFLQAPIWPVNQQPSKPSQSLYGWRTADYRFQPVQ